MTSRSVCLAIILFAGCSDSGSPPSPPSPPDPVVPVSGFISTPPAWLHVGETLEYRATVVGEAPVFSLETAPTGMSVDTAGYVTWTPGAGDVGTHDVVVVAAVEGTDYRQEFELTVSGLEAIGSQNVTTAGGTVSIDAVTVEVPAGALAEEVVVTVSRVVGPPDFESFSDVVSIGDLLNIEAHTLGGDLVTWFLQPLTVTVAYDPADLDGVEPTELYAYYVDANVEGLALAWESVVDPVAETVTFETPHLCDLLLGYVGRLAYTELVNEDDVQVLHRVPLDDRAEATLYCQQVHAGVVAARAKAGELGFNRPSGTIQVRVTDERGSGGHYDNISGILYVDWKLRNGRHRVTAAHEYFHAVQDQYVNMFAGWLHYLWFLESSAPWFETHFDPEALDTWRRNSAPGYLRTPLMTGVRDDAYALGTFIDWAEERSPGFVLRVLQAMNGGAEILPAIEAEVGDLDVEYPSYVIWALQNFGHSNAASVERSLSVTSNAVNRYDNYNEYGVRQTPSVQPLVADPTSGAFQTNLAHFTVAERYRAYVQRIGAEGASRKLVRVRWQYSAPSGSSLGWIVGRRNGSPVLLRAVVAHDPNWARVANFGSGATDRVDEIYLVFTDTVGDGAGMSQWEVEIFDQPANFDLEIPIPVDNRIESEVRVYTPGEYDMPRIHLDLSADPEASKYSITMGGMNAPDQPIEVMWHVVGTIADLPVTYGDPNIGDINSARVGGGTDVERVPAPSMLDYQHILIFVTGVDEQYYIRGENHVRLLDGPVTFQATLSPNEVMPAHENPDPVPVTPVRITGTVDNRSSMPFVINGIELDVTGDDYVDNELRDTGATPLVIVPPGQVGTFFFDEVQLDIYSAWHGTVQHPRLYVDSSNPHDLIDPAVQWPALFWAEVHSLPTELTILTPP